MLRSSSRHASRIASAARASSSGTKNGSVGHSMICLVAMISSSPSGRSMRTRCVALVRRRIPNDGAYADEARTVVCKCRFGRPDQRRKIAPIVDAFGMPTIRREARPHVLAEAQVRPAVDRDLVVVPKDDELAKLQVTCDRRGLRRHAFHDVAVGRDDPGAVIEERVACGCARPRRGLSSPPCRRSPPTAACSSPGAVRVWLDRSRRIRGRRELNFIRCLSAFDPNVYGIGSGFIVKKIAMANRVLPYARFG